MPNSPLEQLVIEVGTELDKIANNGRQLSRRMIIELATERAFSLGYITGHKDGATQVAEEDLANLKALMEKRT